jgi:hypothetical protein
MVYPSVNSSFELLDLNQYDTTKGNYSMVLENGTYMTFFRYAAGYTVTLEAPDTYFAVVKNYDKRRYILSKGLSFIAGGFRQGTWYYFDDSGKLSKQEDNDKAYPFTFEKLYEFVLARKIPLQIGHIAQGLPTKISKRDTPQGPEWVVVWVKDHTKVPNVLEALSVDGVTGKLKDTAYTNYTPAR